MKDEKNELAFRISNKLEKKIIEKNISIKKLSLGIGMNLPNASKNRNLLKKGKMCSLTFLIGITFYFKEIFLDFKDA